MIQMIKTILEDQTAETLLRGTSKLQATVPLAVVIRASQTTIHPQKESSPYDLAQAQFLDVAAEALQEEVNGEAAMHWMDPIRLRFNNHAT